MTTSRQYISIALLLASCAREPQTIFVDYRPASMLQTETSMPSQVTQQPQVPAIEQKASLVEKASKYAVESGLAKKLWAGIPDDKKWELIKSVIESELKETVSNRLRRLEDNFAELYNFMNEAYKGVTNESP